MRFLAIFSLLALAACATKYQDMGLSGGVTSQQLTSNTFRIVARGNGVTGRTAVQEYMMLKAAETTKQYGGTHFMIISAADASGTDQIVTPGYAQTTLVVGGNSAYAAYNPGLVSDLYQPGQDACIRIFRLRPKENAPAGAISADEIIQFAESRSNRG